MIHVLAHFVSKGDKVWGQIKDGQQKQKENRRMEKSLTKHSFDDTNSAQKNHVPNSKNFPAKSQGSFS